MAGHRQRYHLEPPCGLMNDPNGLAEYNGKYYVFFQWNRFAKDHTSKEWGWFESEDLVRWTFRGSALVPDHLFDRDGVLSGSAAVGDDGLYLFYTGKVIINGERRSHQCVALMRDSRHFIKLGPVVSTPTCCTEHFRDPSVRRLASGTFLMSVGGQRAVDGMGSIFTFRSQDARVWQPAGELARSSTYEMVECTEIVRLGAEEVLLYCLQHRDNERDVCGESFSVYKPVHLDEKRLELAYAGERDLDYGWRRVDAGFDFYAPQTIVCSDGRRILFGWMSRMEEPQERVFSEGVPYIHCQTMPRELSWEHGCLVQRPVRELACAMSRAVPLTAGEARPATRAWRCRVEASGDLAVDINGDARLVFDAAAGELVLWREALDKTGRECRRVALDRLRNFDIWSDTSSVEVFVNDGETVLSARIAPGAGGPCVKIDGADYVAKISEFEIADR